MKYKAIIVVLAVILICSFVLRLPYYVTLLIIVVGFPIIFFKTTVAVIGNFYYMKGDENKSRPILKKAIELNTNSPAAHLNYAVLLMRESRENGNKALALLQKSERLNTQLMLGKNISLAIGSCYWILGEVDQAIEVLEGMRRKYDYVNARVLTTLGYMYLLKEDYEKALEISEKAVEESPESASAWDNIGQIYYRQKDTKKAKEALNKAVSFKNDMPDSLYYLGQIAEAEGDKTLAKEYYERAEKSEITGLSTITRQMVEEKIAQLK